MNKQKYEYLNNKKLYEAFKQWDKNTPMPDNIAKSIMMICDQLTKSGKFVGYTWREDMYGDAVLACYTAAKNFNIEKSTNPFSFFTTVAFNACRRRINIEHGNLATQTILRQNMETLYDQTDKDMSYDFIDNSVKNYSQNNTKNYVHPSEKKKKKRKEKNNAHDDMFGDV